MLRNSYATLLVTSGVDIKTVQDLMRHSNIDTTLSVYTHIKDQHKLDAVNNVFEIKSGEFVASSKLPH